MATGMPAWVSKTLNFLAHPAAPSISSTIDTSQQAGRPTSSPKIVSSRSRRKVGMRKPKTIKPRSPARSARLADDNPAPQVNCPSQEIILHDLYENKSTQTQDLPTDGAYSHAQTNRSHDAQTRRSTRSDDVPVIWNGGSLRSKDADDEYLEQTYLASENYSTLDAPSDLGGVPLDTSSVKDVDEPMDLDSRPAQDRSINDRKQATTGPEDPRVLEGPPFTNGDAQVILANDGSKDCLALLLTHEMVTKINQIATRSRRLEFITAKSKAVKQESISAENLVEYKTDALQDTDNQAEIARIKEDIEQAQERQGEAAKRLNALEDEIETLTANLAYSREQCQEILEDSLGKMDLLDIHEPEFASEVRPYAEIHDSKEQSGNHHQQTSAEPYDWVEETNRWEHDDIEVARHDFEEKRNALAELDDMFEHRQYALAEEKAEYRRCVEEGICHITQTDFDLMDLQDFGKLTGKFKKAQEDFEESFRRAKEVGALDERDAHYQESVFSEWSGGYPMSLEDAMIGSAPLKRISFWQDTVEPENIRLFGEMTGTEPWGAPDTEPEALEMDDCDIKSAAISDSWSCVDRSRNRRRIDRWREITGRDR
ncbi:MAG: hypothetical protein Q9218_007591 [Villophora microphyllina]